MTDQTPAPASIWQSIHEDAHNVYQADLDALHRRASDAEMFLAKARDALARAIAHGQELERTVISLTAMRDALHATVQEKDALIADLEAKVARKRPTA